MDIEKLSVDLRPRPHWQAIDLGFELLRSRAAAVLVPWWIAWTGIVAIACVGTALTPKFTFLWPLLPWALRPMVERMVVHVLSRGVFQEEVTWRQTLRAWPGTWKGGLFRTLTWWRLLVPGRSFLQPIWQLEGAEGEFAARRRSVLSRHGAGRVAGAWGLVCAHIEGGLWFSCLILVGLFTESGSNGNPFLFIGQAADPTSNLFAQISSVAAYGLASGFVGPFYAAGGFALYLDRRAELEAWDIELAFRKMKRRREVSRSDQEASA